jgi:hypothetical protein
MKPIILGEFHSNYQIPDISKQEPSTVKALMRDPNDDLKHFQRADPDDWKKEIVMRPLDPQEINKYQAERMARQFSCYYRGEPISKRSEHANRQNAIDAFRFTSGANVTVDEVKARGVNLNEYRTTVIEKWIELTWWKAVLHKIRGNQIKEEDLE